MSERLQVSEKTVQRNFAAIRKLGIEFIREGGKTYGHWVINIGDKSYSNDSYINTIGRIYNIF